MTVYDDTLFRAQIPQYSDPVAYPAALVSAYWDMASEFISANDSPCRSLNGGALALALNYMTAHLMSITPSATAGAGAVQGGYETGARIGDVSVSKLAPPAKDGWSFWLYQSSYGQALMALLSAKSVGGFSVGGLPERDGFRKAYGVFW